MDTTPIAARLSAIARSVSALRELQRLSLDEFEADHILQSAAERDFQVAIQAALDIASMVLASVSVDVPVTYAEIFAGLADIDVIPADFAQKLVGMAKFRNVLVHMYLEVDLKLMYRYIQDNLEDFEAFTRYVSEYLASQ
jgi:uncharacterized protein YutE (UPF0331/DUF86 family)